MSRAEAPLIDPRTYQKLVAEVEELILQYTGKPAPPEGDAGGALVRIFGHMAELVVTRLNRLPDRNFLAFLDLIGTRLNPPQPARVPLTFLLAAGSPVDALVPAGTQAVAAALEGEVEPPQFETERDLVVTRSQLVGACTRDPERDRWADHTAIATGQTAGTFLPFRGDGPIGHRLYVDHPLLGLPETKTVVLRIGLADKSPAWPSNVTWSFRDGDTWKPLDTKAPLQNAVELTAAGFASTAVHGIDGHWLRGELNTSGGDWSQPLIDSLSVEITIDRRAERKLPERGFANQTPLDLSKDFLPFGEKPKVGDAFYLASDEAFSKPDAKVDLYVDLSSGTPPAADGLVLAWEFWDGSEWKPLGNNDNTDEGTRGFIQSGTLHFTVPSKLAPTEVNGEVRHWLRVRIASGNYGVEARYGEVNGASKLIPATFRPPSLRSMRLGYLSESKPEDQEPRRVLTENDFHFKDVTGSPFTPFVPSKDSRPTLYLGFERPGDPTGFANRTTALFFQVAETLYDPAAEQEMVIEEAVVVWEYWNGEVWQRLGTSDETRGLTRSGLVTFIGPPDFKSSADFGRMAFWLRCCWKRGNYTVEPRLVRVFTNTTWASHTQTIRGEILGSSRGEHEQIFHTLHTPVLEGQSLDVIETEVPPGADLAELEEEEGDDAVAVIHDSVGQPVEVRVRWHEVTDFYGSGPRSRHYVLDRRSGEVRFGDGRRGLVPPPGRNNVLMAQYRAGGGLAGNRPAGSITQLKGTVPYVTGVAQPVPAEGGAAEESLEAVRIRGPRRLRHRDRAAAAADFEDLAFQSSSQVARARALPVRSSSGRGHVDLIVVPAADVAKPVPGLELLARVRSYLEARLSPVVSLQVTGPDWLQVDVQAEVVPRQLDAATDVQNAVLQRLRAFLHPLSGGPQGEGWEIGRRPHRSDFYALIEETPGVDHLRRLEVTETLELSEPAEKGEAEPERLLVFSGNHVITISGSVDDAAGTPGSPA